MDIPAPACGGSAPNETKTIYLSGVPPQPPPTAAAASPPTQRFTSEQQLVIEKFRCGENIFITGPGGTGKSFLLRELLHQALEDKREIQIAAMTGRAAVLLNCRARTIHSWSGIRLAKGDPEEIVSRTVRRRGIAKAWRSIKVLIIDEVSMMSAKVFEILNDIGKITRKNYLRPFGGLQVVFIGDFFQLPPIGDADDPKSGQYCFESPLWAETFPHENHVKLTHVFRQSGDPTFIKILTQIREGRITRSSHEILQSVMEKKFDTDAAERLGLPIPTKLFPLRASAERLNAYMFSQIAAPVMEYPIQINRQNTVYLDEGTPIPTDILRECSKLTEQEIAREIDQMVENSPCVDNLALKEGTLVMLCYNLDVEIGLCNGSQGVVVGFQDLPPPTQATMSAPRPNMLYPRVKFSNGITTTIGARDYQSANYPTLSFSQIPLKMAWGLTIHSSQGATLDMAEIDIGSGIFEVGQTYVALSRVRSLDGLYLLGYDPTKIKVSRKVIEFYRGLPEIK